jgi:hypothetical protein
VDNGPFLWVAPVPATAHVSSVSQFKRDWSAAWRIVYATMLARALPDAPCTAVLADDKWQALGCARYDTTTPPDTPPTIREAVREIAHLGSFLGRRHDGKPGVSVLFIERVQQGGKDAQHI